MDVFKLAFETTVVGLLTIGWLSVAAYLLFPDFPLDSVFKNFLHSDKDSEKTLAASGVGALLLAYCLGSAILPISNQLVNDEHWPLNESAIRCQVFTQQELNLNVVRGTALDSPLLFKDKALTLGDLRPRHCSYWAPVFFDKKPILTRVKWFLQRWIAINIDEKLTQELKHKAPEEQLKACESLSNTVCDEIKAKAILTIFQQEETSILSQPSQRNESLRQLHERIVVLRGMVFSLFVLLLLCLFAYFARVNGSMSHWIKPACGVTLAAAFTIFAGFNGVKDMEDPDIFDIPILECLLVIISVLGFVLAIRKANNKRFRSKSYVLTALFFTGLAYGGWMWSEVIYDQQVINTFAVSQKAPLSAKE